MDNLYIIVGLGNPGLKHAGTRHNMGFITLDVLADKAGIKVKKLKHKALTGEGCISGADVLLVKPQTFMNDSGESVREVTEWYKLPLDRLILIHDDIDIGPGRIRVRSGGSAGTHNGMRSVIYHLQDDRFPRVRIGIGKPPEGWDLVDFVLGRIRSEEADALKQAVVKAVEAVETIIAEGVETAMNRFNGNGRKDGDENGAGSTNNSDVVKRSGTDI